MEKQTEEHAHLILSYLHKHPQFDQNLCNPFQGRTATRLVSELCGMTYKEHLIELDLPTQDNHKKRFDGTQVCKIVPTVFVIDMNVFYLHGKKVRANAR